MKFKDALIEANTWQRRVALISFYHNMRLAKNRKWKLIDSAKYFKVSIGLISESLLLSENWDEIKECQSRNEALKRIRK